MSAPHGINLVIECSDGSAVIGRFDESNGFEIVMHDVDLWNADQGTAEEPLQLLKHLLMNRQQNHHHLTILS